MVSQQVILARTFVEIADTLVADYDVIEVLVTLSDRCVDLFGGEAGIMLADREGELHVAASSSDRVQHLELFELQHEEGPCPDAYHRREAVTCADLARDLARWPKFAPAALASGFHAVHAIPMRLRDQSLGAINLMFENRGDLTDDDLSAVQALADVASIALLQHRAAEDARIVVGQLQGALESRVVIEQAKGIVAQVLRTDMDQAFALMRDHARRNNRRLAAVAKDVTTRGLDPRRL